MDTSVSALQWLNVVLTAATAFRLYQLKLHTKYRIFFVYLLYRTARSLALAFIDRNTLFYRDVYVWTSPSLWVLYILLVYELYSLSLKDYAGLRTIGRRLTYAAAVVAVAVWAAIVASEPELANSGYLFQRTSLFERALLTSLIATVVLLLAFLSWFAVRLKSNLVVHTSLYSTYFISSNIGWLVLHAILKRVSPAFSLAMVSIATVCLAGWLTLLSAEGERREQAFPHLGDAARERRLREQLESLNSAALRAIRK